MIAANDSLLPIIIISKSTVVNFCPSGGSEQTFLFYKKLRHVEDLNREKESSRLSHFLPISEMRNHEIIQLDYSFINRIVYQNVKTFVLKK